jgi:cell division protein FtsB
MKDIGGRIRRYRLGRYAPDASPLGRRLRWVWVIGLAWLTWAALLSEHSFYRTWKLDRENRQARTELARLRSEVERLDAESRDPAANRVRAERQLRERHGMAKPGEIIYMIQPRGADTLSRQEP